MLDDMHNEMFRQEKRDEIGRAHEWTSRRIRKVCTLHDMLHFTTYTLLIAITHVCVCILAPHANYLHKCSTKGKKKERSDVFT